MDKIKYILSDLDGVIRKFPSERDLAIEKKYSLPKSLIHDSAFEKALLDQVIHGQITDEEWRVRIEKKMASVVGYDVAHSAILEWSEFPGEVDLEYLKILKNSFLNIPIVLLTNGTSRLNSDLARLKLTNQFFKVYNSAELGVSKPSKEVFDFVMRDLDCKSTEIFFIDDSVSHIEMADSMGMLTHHYVSNKHFENFLTNKN